MSKYKGYMGRVLEINLSTREISEYPWSDKERKLYLGGKAMASKIMYDRFDGSEKALSEENKIIISTGPLTGSFAPSSNRFNISSLSPLTGITASSNCGGNFGFYLKKAGFDALIISGKADKLSWLLIENDKISFFDAAEFEGMLVTETQELMQKKTDELLGKKTRCGMVCIGPAGENLVRYSSVMSGDRAAGRCGLGAVFGSKNLKGAVATGTHEIPIHDKDKTIKHHRKWTAYLRDHMFTGGVLPKQGTAGILRYLQQSSTLATRNFGRGQYWAFENVTGEALQRETIINFGCLSCPIRCSRSVVVNGQEVKGPELEALGLLGPNLLISDLNAICELSYELDELGMDVMSAAGTVAWAMDANEKGLWDNGLKFGVHSNLKQTFSDTAFRRGIGDELAEGSKRLSEKYGGKEFAIHSKGLELAAYEPRRAVGQGLGYAVSNRGGCHLNGGYLILLEAIGLRVDGETIHAKADLCMFLQDLIETTSSSGHCLFTLIGFFPSYLLNKPNSLITRAVNKIVPYLGWALRVLNYFPELAFFKIPLLPHLYEIEYVTGMKMNIGKFKRIGERSYNIERAVNAKFGVSADMDKLPKRLVEDLQDPDRPNSRVPLEKLKKIYYRARGWNKNGLPSKLKLRLLGIK